MVFYRFLIFISPFITTLALNSTCCAMMIEREDVIDDTVVELGKLKIQEEARPFASDEDHINKEEPVKFRKEDEDRLASYQGKSPAEVLKEQLNSKDWFERNWARCFKAFQLLKSDPLEADKFIVTAHNQGYAPATFELFRRAVEAQEYPKARNLLSITCSNLIQHERELGNQMVDGLIKSIKTLAKKNPELENTFHSFRVYTTFQINEKQNIVVSLSEKELSKLNDLTENGKLFNENNELIIVDDEFKIGENQSLEVKKPLMDANDEVHWEDFD